MLIRTLITALLALSASNVSAFQSNLFGPEDYPAKVSPTGDPTVFLVEYPSKKVYHDCNTGLPRMAIQYVSRVDQSTSVISNELFFEKSLSPSCQPNQNTRVGVNSMRIYDENGLTTHQMVRLIPFSASSYVVNGVYESDSVATKTTNLFPAVREFASGPYYRYQQYLQCLRSQTDFLLVNGVINTEKPNQYLLNEFNIAPADFMWSAILLPNGSSIGFLFSNQKTKTRTMNSNIARNILSLEMLEKTLKFQIPMTSKHDKKTVAVELPVNKSLTGCRDF